MKRKQVIALLIAASMAAGTIGNGCLTLPVFAALRAEGDIIALPAIVKEDGTVFADWEAYLQELGLDVVYREED